MERQAGAGCSILYRRWLLHALLPSCIKLALILLQGVQALTASLALCSSRASCFWVRNSAASAFAAIFFSQLVRSLGVPVALMRGAGAFQFFPDTCLEHRLMGLSCCSTSPYASIAIPWHAFR